jgi:V8-like Glu-specific endopeptidase
VLKLDAAQIAYVKSQPITVRKIALELRIFLQGTPEIKEHNGIKCNVLATSEDENVDLALLQTTNKKLPDTSIKLIDLSRIGMSNADSVLPKMSERLILIGYNRGTDLANTTAGIQAQLTDGKVSQNTDAYKLMYTIPTLPGSSGSPVMDDKGRLVSVNFAGMSETQSFNYGIQPKQIKSFLEENNITL